MPAKSSKSMKENKCECNMPVMVVAWIAAAIGFWALVGGFATQFLSGNPTSLNLGVMAFYFVGLLFISCAKILKWKAVGCCMVHKM